MKNYNSDYSGSDYGDIFNMDLPPPTKEELEGTPGTLYDPFFAPDNLTSGDFLEQNLKRNPFPYDWDYHTTLMKTGRCVIQFSAVCTFHVLHCHLGNGLITPNQILLGCLILTISGYLIGKTIPEVFKYRKYLGIGVHLPREHIRLLAIFLVYSYQMSPLLRSLSVEVSYDTIRYMATVLTLLHLLTTNYGIESFMTSPAVSVNSALIATICFCSRLQSSYHCFALLVLTVVTYILFPIFSRVFWDSSLILILSILVASVACYTFSPTAFLFFVTAITLILFLVPLLLVRSLQYKNNIYGPWDEAIIEPYERATKVKPHDPYR